MLGKSTGFFSQKLLFVFQGIRAFNSLDPDQTGCFVRPDLSPNCLQRSADDTSHQKVIADCLTTCYDPKIIMMHTKHDSAICIDDSPLLTFIPVHIQLKVHYLTRHNNSKACFYETKMYCY